MAQLRRACGVLVSHDSLEAHHRGLALPFSACSRRPQARAPRRTYGKAVVFSCDGTSARRSSRARCGGPQGAEDADALHAAGLDAGRAGVAQGRAPKASGRGSPRPSSSASTRTTRPSGSAGARRATARWSTSAGGRRAARRSGPSGRSRRVCKQPDARPDLVVRNVRVEDGSYVARGLQPRAARRPGRSRSTSSSTALGRARSRSSGWPRRRRDGDDARSAGTACAAGHAARGGRRRALPGRRGRRGQQRPQRVLLSQPATASQ